MTFDVSKYQVKNPEPITIKVDEEEIELVVRDMPWVTHQEILAQCFAYNEDGTGTFNESKYTKECLKYMVVTAPWGKTNEVFLTTLKGGTSLIEALRSLVPKPWITKDDGENLKDSQTDTKDS